MNREIKFRAWDGKYIIHSEYGDWISFEGKPYTDAEKKYNTPHMEIEPANDYILMQYTGLKDKNGKEIYDGDIIKHVISGHGIKPWVLNYIVRWYVFGWRWQKIVPKDKLKKSYDGISIPPTPIIVALRDFQSCEVIGNIYENPELLTTHE